MIQEYLFVDDRQRSEVEKYRPDKVSVDISNIENSACWVVSYSLPGENRESAKSLSIVNTYIVEHFNPIVLANESSAYFNRILYPFINEFERKLRKLLYLKSAVYQGDRQTDNIKDLEKKTLGAIFELLFTDIEFIKNAKAKINDKNWHFAKNELILVLQGIGEDTLWDRLFGKDGDTLLRDNFLTVKNYRNDVMHARNIDYETFEKAKKLFDVINEQLDKEIGLIIQRVEDQCGDIAEAGFNDLLHTALQAQKLDTANLARLQEPLIQIQEVLSNTGYIQLQEVLQQNGSRS